MKHTRLTNLRRLLLDRLGAALLATSLLLLGGQATAAVTPSYVPSVAAGQTYFNSNCSSCHNNGSTPGFNSNVKSDFSYLKISYPKGLQDLISAHLVGTGNNSLMQHLASAAVNDDDLRDLAVYFRTFAPAATITVNQDYAFQTAIPGYVQTVITSPAITVQAACMAGGDLVDTQSVSIPAGTASGAISGLLQGESCTLSQTAGPTGGSLSWGHTFGPVSAAMLTPGSIATLGSSNTATVTTLVQSPAAASLRLTASFANNSPSHVDPATPLNFNVHCTRRSSDVTGSFAANASLDVNSFALGDSCSVSASISSGATPPSNGYTFGAFTYVPAQPITLAGGTNPVSLTNTLVTPPATIRVKAAFLGDASRITTQPKLNLRLSCAGRTDQLDGFTTTANASVTFSGLLAGDQCQITEVSVNPAAVLSGNYLLSAAPTSITPSGNFTLVAGTNDVTVTHTVIAPGAAQFNLPGPLTFAAEVGASSTKATVISNSAGNGSAYLTLGTMTFSDPVQYAFGPGNTCTPGLVMPPLAPPCDLVVTFTPSAPAPTLSTGPQQRYAKLTITHDAAGSPAQLDLNGTANPAPSPSIQIDYAIPAFADTYLGSNTSAVVTVTNSTAATAALQISALTLSGAAAGDYALGGGSTPCAVGSSLAAGTSCKVRITFTPSQTGARNAQLTIGNNTPNSTPVITLSGVGIEKPVPVLSIVSTTPIHFGNRTVGGSYQPQALTLQNKGKADLMISAVQVTGAGFSTADSCPPTIAPDAQCQLRIQYTPQTAGQTDQGSVVITSNAAGSPQSVLMDGMGVTYTAPVFVWDGTTLDFGNVSAGEPSAPQPLTITNVGPGDATLTLVNVTGVDAANFVLAMQDCKLGKSVIEGTTCHLTLQFVPTASGSRKAALQWSSTGSTPAPVTLQGVGLAGVSAQLALSTNSLSFGTVRVGASSLPQELTLQSSGTSLLHVATISVGAPYKVVSKDCAEPPFDLMPGMQCKLMLGFVPSTAGAGNATIHISSNSTQAVPDVALSGEGQQEAEVSGGGCSLASGRAPFDPVLLVLALGACIVLWVRRRREVGRTMSTESRS